VSIYSEIFSALIGAFHGIKLSSGDLLHSSTNKIEATPRLLWKIGGWKSETWQPFMYRVTWTVPCELLVQGEAGSPFTALDVLGDLYDYADMIYGLPVDAKGNVVPVGDKQRDMMARGELFSIADRFVGPYINSATPKPGEADSTFTAVDLAFGMEFIVDATPEAKARAMYWTVGANPDNPTRTAIERDPSQPFSNPIAPDADTRSQGAYSQPDTTLRYGGQIIKVNYPPAQQDIPAVAGGDPAKTIASIEIAPAAVTVTSTKQLSCNANYKDRGTSDLTAAAQWSSGSPSVATVSATGLVTKVSVGTAVITATFNGFSATCAVTTA